MMLDDISFVVCQVCINEKKKIAPFIFFHLGLHTMGRNKCIAPKEGLAPWVHM